jgi:hypothetical protein
MSTTTTVIISPTAGSEGISEVRYEQTVHYWDWYDFDAHEEVDQAEYAPKNTYEASLMGIAKPFEVPGEGNVISEAVRL